MTESGRGEKRIRASKDGHAAFGTNADDTGLIGKQKTESEGKKKGGGIAKRRLHLGAFRVCQEE